MTLDHLDHAFLDRWNAVPTPTASETCAASADPPTPPPAPPLDGTASVAGPPAADFIARLLDAARPEWSRLADEIELARGRGRRAIAITACERAAGCSTLVAAVVRILRDRGRDAISLDRSDMPSSGPAAEHGPAHDKRIVLVDAGVWFPPGRIHRQRLVVASTGCDAAILVRRPGREAPAAWGAALEAIGVEPLGEVISFAAPAGASSAAGAPA
jgi:hypothetical protein